MKRKKAIKNFRVFSVMAAVCATVCIGAATSISFAQNSGSSDAMELEDKVKNMENRIEQYKSCISQERPGEIILYQDPSTGDCMAITTTSFKNYLEEKGLTDEQVKERLRVWDEKSSKLKKRLEKDIVVNRSKLNDLRNKLTHAGKPGASTGAAAMPAAVRFDYPEGQAEADGRNAELHLAIDGTRVQGEMTAKAVCKTGIRLPKTQITFVGKIDGPWENKTSVITADWKGGDYGCDGVLMKGYSKEGTLAIQMRRDGNSSEYSIFLKRTAGAPYGFVFKPLRKAGKAGKSGKQTSDISGVWSEKAGAASPPADGKKPGSSGPAPNNEETKYWVWTFTPLGNNRYKAHYKGEFIAEGIALMQGNKVAIDFTVDDLKIHYDLRLSQDGTKAVGKWTSSDGESENTVLVREKQKSPASTKELTYTGIAMMDSRRATVKFKITENDVEGTAEISSICKPNIHLGGASMTFTGKLSGKWESKAGSIFGTWKGTDHICGKDIPNDGSFKLFYKDEGDPVIHFRLKGRRGQYGYNLTPHNTVYASGNAAPPEADPGKPAKTTKPKNPAKPVAVTPDELKEDNVAQILVFPSELVLAPGGRTAMPDVYAVIKSSAEQLKIASDKVKWVPNKSVEVRGSGLIVSDKLNNGDSLSIKAVVKIGVKTFTAKVKIRIVKDAKTGVYSGKVNFVYSPRNTNASRPRAPAWRK